MDDLDGGDIKPISKHPTTVTRGFDRENNSNSENQNDLSDQQALLRIALFTCSACTR
jgi:hypothetical protein